MFMMRFDLRVPGMTPAQVADQYAAAIEMAEWAEDKGCLAVVVSEHHASPDGYLPTPLVLATAMAARTTSLPIAVGAALLKDGCEGILAETGPLHALENSREQRDIAVDEIEAGFVGLAAEAGGDDENIAVLRAGVITGVDALIGDGRGAVQEVERLTVSHVGIGVEDLDFGYDAGALECEGGVGTDAATAADDGDFHDD